MITVIQSPPRSRHVAKDLANRRLSRLVAYAVVIPLVIAVLAAPIVVVSSILGIVSAVGVSRLRTCLSQSNNSAESDIETHTPDLA